MWRRRRRRVTFCLAGVTPSPFPHVRGADHCARLPFFSGLAGLRPHSPFPHLNGPHCACWPRPLATSHPVFTDELLGSGIVVLVIFILGAAAQACTLQSMVARGGERQGSRMRRRRAAHGTGGAAAGHLMSSLFPAALRRSQHSFGSIRAARAQEEVCPACVPLREAHGYHGSWSLRCLCCMQPPVSAAPVCVCVWGGGGLGAASPNRAALRSAPRALARTQHVGMGAEKRGRRVPDCGSQLCGHCRRRRRCRLRRHVWYLQQCTVCVCRYTLEEMHATPHGAAHTRNKQRQLARSP